MSSAFLTIPFEVAVQGKYFISCFHVMAGPHPRGEVVDLWKASPPLPLEIDS